MDIEATYQKIIRGLEAGSRSLIRYSPEEIQDLTAALEQELAHPTSRLEKLLCLVDHAATDHSAWEPLILRALTMEVSPQMKVFALNCARKHILQARFKRGHRLDHSFLEVLKLLLFSPSPEVVEWTLRTIEECGSQGVYFLREFDKIKPPPWKWFNPHQRAVREIITMLERRWSKIETR